MTDETMIRRAMAKLSNPHRALIHRAYYLKRTTSQIAAEFNTSECAVLAKLHDAMRELRRILLDTRIAV